MSAHPKNTNTGLDLGLTTAEIREQVIERAAEKLRDSIDTGDYSHLDKVVKEATDKAVTRYMDAVIVPRVEKEISTITFQATNKWGESRGKALTFREYLIERAEAWITEEVNYEGKPKGTNSYSWKPYQTRVAHMVHEHLHFEIKRAIETMLKTANAKLVEGIEKTVKIKLAEIQTALTVKTDVKS
jgi:microcompartment protein CcmL/EutN